MTRIGSYGSSQQYITQIMNSQSRLNDLQNQVSTNLRSPNYSGISSKVNIAINFENAKADAQAFIDNNTLENTSLVTASTSMKNVTDTALSFRQQLTRFMSLNTQDPAAIKTLQDSAFQAMQSIQSDLNLNVNGQYLFSGGRTSSAPIQLPANTLSDFQTLYDGNVHSVPTTRSANLLQTSLTKFETTSLKFSAAEGIIVPAAAASLLNVASGSTVSVSGTAGNNTNFTINSHAATNVGGAALQEISDAGITTQINYGSGASPLTNATTGALQFAFASNGNMTIKPTTANSLWNLSVGMKFTVQGSTVGNYDGAYKVVSNSNGIVEIATDTDTITGETITQTALDTPLVVSGSHLGVPLVLSVPANRQVSFTANPSAVTGMTSITMTSSNQVDFAGFVAGDVLTLAGSQHHNGQFTVASSSQTATTSSITFNVNSDALRVSKLLPQAGRTDVTMSFVPGINTIPNISVTAPAIAPNVPPTTPYTTTITAGAYGTLTFSPNQSILTPPLTGVSTTGETITATTGTPFNDMLGNPVPAVGQVFKLSSTTGVNDGMYVVTANNGSSIQIKGQVLSSEQSTTAKIAADTWYKGDSLQVNHRIDNGRTVSVSTAGSDPAIEKVLRALALISQGEVGTAGGLDNNQGRIQSAQYLLSDAIDNTATGKPPFGAEAVGNLQQLASNIGYVAKIFKDTAEKHSNNIALFDAAIINIEQITPAEAITSLLSEQNSLQASYQALAKVSGLSLLNYLK